MSSFRPASPSSYAMAFRDWFGLTRGQADLLVALYDAGGELKTPRELGVSAGVAASSVPFHLVDVRRALEVEAIDCEPSRGYRLTEEGLAECRDALLRIGAELLGAA